MKLDLFLRLLQHLHQMSEADQNLFLNEANQSLGLFNQQSPFQAPGRESQFWKESNSANPEEDITRLINQGQVPPELIRSCQIPGEDMGDMHEPPMPHQWSKMPLPESSILGEARNPGPPLPAVGPAEKKNLLKAVEDFLFVEPTFNDGGNIDSSPENKPKNDTS